MRFLRRLRSGCTLCCQAQILLHLAQNLNFCGGKACCLGNLGNGQPKVEKILGYFTTFICFTVFPALGTASLPTLSLADSDALFPYKLLSGIAVAFSLFGNVVGGDKMMSSCTSFSALFEPCYSPAPLERHPPQGQPPPPQAGRAPRKPGVQTLPAEQCRYVVNVVQFQAAF